MEKYRFLDDLTSDVMFEAFGKNLAELLSHSAEALFSVVCNISQVERQQAISLTVTADNPEDLLYEWLSTLLTESEIHGLFLSCFEITDLQSGAAWSLQATAWGEPVCTEKGDTVVKGITYYGFKLEKSAAGYRARVAMDI